MLRATLSTILWIATGGMVAAGPPRLSLPADCTLGESCYVEDYVDSKPGEGMADYTCGLKSRDGHRGTDFVLLSFEAMEAGVDVLAAAPGRVAATRDDVADRPVTDETRESIRGRECGNGVRIDHGEGWQTLYCHMARDSIAVRPGDKVQRGARLGRIGLSGLTNVPHVHLGVLHEGRVIDPFNPDHSETCGAGDGVGLWQNAPPYTPTGLFTAGFATAVPEFDAVKSGAARVRETSPDKPIVLYGHAFYPEPGDILRFTASGPEGEIFRHDITLEDPRAQIMRAFGRRSPPGGWPEGAYRGYIRLERDGLVVALRHADITVNR